MKFAKLLLFLVLCTSVMALPPSFEDSGLPPPADLGSSDNAIQEDASAVPTTTESKYVTQEQFDELKSLVEEKYAPQSNSFLYGLMSFIAIISFAGLVTSTYAIKGKKEKKDFHDDQFEELVIYFRTHKFQGKNALAGVAARAGWDMKQIDNALKEAGVQ